MIVYRCPRCAKDNGLWQAIHVSAWQPLAADGTTNKHKRDVDWAWVEELDEGGCGECGWEGMLATMRVTLGIDGEPLPEIHPGQQEIAA